MEWKHVNRLRFLSNLLFCFSCPFAPFHLWEKSDTKLWLDWYMIWLINTDRCVIFKLIRCCCDIFKIKFMWGITGFMKNFSAALLIFLNCYSRFYIETKGGRWIGREWQYIWLSTLFRYICRENWFCLNCFEMSIKLWVLRAIVNSEFLILEKVYVCFVCY